MAKNETVCYFCQAKVEDAKHIALDEEGEIVCMCDPCYDLAAKFFTSKRATYTGGGRYA